MTAIWKKVNPNPFLMVYIGVPGDQMRSKIFYLAQFILKYLLSLVNLGPI